MEKWDPPVIFSELLNFYMHAKQEMKESVFLSYWYLNNTHKLCHNDIIVHYLCAFI